MAEGEEQDEERTRLGSVAFRAHLHRGTHQVLDLPAYEAIAWAVREAVYDDVGLFLAQADYAAIVQMRQITEAIRSQRRPDREIDGLFKLAGYIRQQHENYRGLAAAFGRPIVEVSGVHPAAAGYLELTQTASTDLPIDRPCPQCGKPEVGILIDQLGPLITDISFTYGCGVCPYREDKPVTAAEQSALVLGLIRGDVRLVRRLRHASRKEESGG